MKEEDLEMLKNHLSFDNMRNNDSVNFSDKINLMKKRLKKENDENLNFIRKGESGEWKNILTHDIIGNKFDNKYRIMPT